jgi:hypothetical protein
MTEKTVLKSERSVTLTKVELRGNGVVIDQQFTVSTRRAPEVKSFPFQHAAEAYFAEEVTRC